MNTQMNPAINTFADLLFVINARPDWREQLVTALFPNFDIQTTLDRMDETNRLLRQDIALVQTRLNSLENRQDKVENRLENVENRLGKVENRLENVEGQLVKVNERLGKLDDSVADLQDSVGRLKGDNYEHQIIARINSVLGSVLRRSRDARNEINDHLDNAEEAGTISVIENDNVNSADFLWQGTTKQSKETIYIVGEMSWLAELHDVERAIQRAQTVQQAGLSALSLVAGQKWTYEAIEAAKEHGVVRIRNFSLEKESWLPALEQMKDNLQS